MNTAQTQEAHAYCPWCGHPGQILYQDGTGQLRCQGCSAVNNPSDLVENPSFAINDNEQDITYIRECELLGGHL